MPSSPQSKQSSHSPQKRSRKHSSSESHHSKSRSKSKDNQQINSPSKRHQSKHERRSRSRQKSHKHHHHHSQKRNEDTEQKERKRISRPRTSNHYDLGLYDHLYFIENEDSKVSVQTAIWSSVMNHGLRPKKILIICQSQKRINRLIKSSNINRQMIVIDHDSKEDIKELIKSNDIILMTQQKSSITLGLDQGDIQLFDLVVNYGKTYSIQFYSLLPQFLGKHGIILTIFQDKKELERHQRKLKINFKQLNGEIRPLDIQKQIFNQMQFSKLFSKSLTFEDLNLLKTPPFSIQQTALRLFTLLKQNYKPKTSLYNNRQGHVTFCLKTDTEFNSIKYIWNFIRQQLSSSVVKNIKDMKKFQNQRGVLFNVPISDLSKWETFQSKISKNDKKYKGYKLYQFINQELPKLQDTQSQQYKLLQQKKQQALKNRHKLELFIAGIPYDANEVDIRKYFSQKSISLFLIRILRDSSGFSKGIAFGLAQNESHFEKAIKLNGQKFGDRQLRIKLADQRDK